MIKFIHTSDLHLGRPFGSFPEDVRSRLKNARQQALPRIAAAARNNGANHVLLAGDTFDAETPQPTTIRHALNDMRDAADMTWVLLPGNHDSLAATELWRTIATDKPTNVELAFEPKPMTIGHEVTLLPSPCTVRHPGRDLTDWMSEISTGDAIRIGLAHGGIRDFRPGEELSEDGKSGVIAPDRAEQSDLTYLALGDWHGRLQITPKTWYSGTPEADSFKSHPVPGVLLVSIEARQAKPIVSPLAIGAINWNRQLFDIIDGEQPFERLRVQLPAPSNRSATLLDLVISGRADLQSRANLERDLSQVAPDFLWHRFDLSKLAIVHQVKDLDLIDTNGALRTAAEQLASEAQSSPDESGRRAASDALARLFSYVSEDQ